MDQGPTKSHYNIIDRKVLFDHQLYTEISVLLKCVKVQTLTSYFGTDIRCTLVLIFQISRQSSNHNPRRPNKHRRISSQSMETQQHPTSRRSKMPLKTSPHLVLEPHIPRVHSPTTELRRIPSPPIRPPPRALRIQNPGRHVRSLCNVSPHNMDPNLRPTHSPIAPKNHQQRRWHYTPPKNGHWHCFNRSKHALLGLSGIPKKDIGEH